MQVSSRWLKLCCSLECGDCGVAVRVQAQDTSEGTVCFRIVWSNSHSLARLRFGIFQLAVLSKRICKIDACVRREDFPSAAPPCRAGKLIQPVFRRASARQQTN